MRYSVFAMTVLSLYVGVAQYSPFIQWLQNSVFQEKYDKLAPFIAFGILLVGCFVSGFVFHCIEDCCYKWRRRTKLKKLYKCCRGINTHLSVVADELDREMRYDSDAYAHLHKSVRHATTGLESLLQHGVALETREFAQRVWCLLSAMEQHARQEVLKPFESATWESVQKTMELKKRSRWGISCVQTLRAHLQKEIIDHPVYNKGAERDLTEIVQPQTTAGGEAMAGSGAG